MNALEQVPDGQKVRVVKIDAGREMTTRLKHMGISEGDEINVLQNMNGPLIVGKGNLRLALGRGMGRKIWVEKL